MKSFIFIPSYESAHFTRHVDRWSQKSCPLISGKHHRCPVYSRCVLGYSCFSLWWWFLTRNVHLPCMEAGMKENNAKNSTTQRWEQCNTTVWWISSRRCSPLLRSPFFSLSFVSPNQQINNWWYQLTLSTKIALKKQTPPFALTCKLYIYYIVMHECAIDNHQFACQLSHQM